MAKRHGNRAGDLESIFLRLEELVLANSGVDEFDEVFKLVVAKLHDERRGGGAFRAYQTEAETHRVLSRLLRGAAQAWPGVLDSDTFALRPEHLRVCVEALAPHHISGTGLPVLDAFFEFLVSKSAKGAKGQYFTPRHVVEFCVRMLKPTPGETVLDPACGSGGFLLHALNHVREFHGVESARAVRDYCGERLWGCDLDARAVRVGRALMILAGDGHANITRLNSLLTPDMKRPGSGDAGLTIEEVRGFGPQARRGFDVILTNPPFAGEVREQDVLSAYELGRGRARIERDILFLERCVRLLRPGGRLAIVLPHNKFAAGTWAFARRWLLQNVRVLAVVGLGRNTFLPHTHQKASVLFAQRLGPTEIVSPSADIFFGISERDGKDSRGRPIFLREAGPSESPWRRIDHDLGEIVDAFDKFCDRKQLRIGA